MSPILSLSHYGVGASFTLLYFAEGIPLIIMDHESKVK
jgi:hypothetical protein